MPNSCAAYGCNHKIGPDTKQKNITFHLLPPPTDSRRNLWISNSRRIDPITRQPWNPSSKYVYFCSDHFMPSDFENPQSKPSSRKLKENAVPTVFTFPTVVPPSPEKQSSTPESSEISTPIPGDNLAIKNKLLSRSKKTKHRKVVMLPKKIKLLQETSTADVESVTIISFQHLDYDEKMQAMFEEAKMDLQYSGESECDQEVEEEEYYDDEYTELQNVIPQHEELMISLKESDKENEMQNTDLTDSNNPKSCMEHDSYSEEIVSKTTGNVEDKTNEKSISMMAHKVVRTELSPLAKDNNELNTQKSLQKEPQKRLPKHKQMFPKRKIPVVIKELILIDDIEELRIKAFRIAEDNIKLKRQVTYLEKKLEEMVSQLYGK